LVFTFTVVASRFHRGRLRFEWVPDTAASGATTTNITYSHVVDIAKSRHFRVTIPYTRREGAYDFGIIGTPLSGNGRLRVRVVNELVSPGAATNISIIPWLAAGSDYEVFDPNDSEFGSLGLVYGVESEEVPTDGGDLSEVVEDFQFFEAPKHELYDLAFFGDPIRSFRALMKRFTFTQSFSIATFVQIAAGPDYVIKLRGPMYPQRFGEVTFGTATVTASGREYNGFKNHLVSFLEPAFLAKRGGFRHVISGTYPDSGVHFSPISVRREDTSSSRYVGLDNTAAGTSANAQPGPRSFYSAQDYDNLTGFQGEQIFPVTGGSFSASFELPFYHQARYVNHLGGSGTGVGPNGSWVSTSYLMTNSPITTADAIGLRYFVHSAASEDFTMNVFLGFPKYETNYTLTTPADVNAGY
jgi:hypothetical protein